MNKGLGDGAWAFIAAVVLLGLASLVVFVIQPGGSQVGWYTALLPGSMVSMMLTGVFQSAMPNAQRMAYLCSTLALSFVWYLLIAYIVVKAVRGAGAKKA
ncbi:MAG TPA: hypothetical protein VMM16_01215 [Verrucomicrobiae bacterium]|nr:hypothetical protein [Verrucomicrobiae bacterium]